MLDSLLAPFTSLQNLVDGGGPFVFWIFVSGVIMWTLVIERIWYFTGRCCPSNPGGHRQVEQRSDHLSWCARQIRER